MEFTRDKHHCFVFCCNPEVSFLLTGKQQRDDSVLWLLNIFPSYRAELLWLCKY